MRRPVGAWLAEADVEPVGGVHWLCRWSGQGVFVVLLGENGADDATGSRCRFWPQVRGWMALRLAPLVPGVLRRSLLQCGWPTGGQVDFRQSAVAATSVPRAIEWCRYVATRAPGLGPAAGSACLARLWVIGVLRPGGPLAAYWPSVVDEVWRVVRPPLAKMGLTVRGRWGEELRHEVASPLALVLLRSLAAARRDLQLLGGGQVDGPPLGWAPGIDAFQPLLRYLLLGQLPGRFHSHALLSSPLAQVACASGLVVRVGAERRRCRSCGLWADVDQTACRCCGGPTVLLRYRRLVARRLLERQPADLWVEPQKQAIPAHATAADLVGNVDAALARRDCIERARRLWEAVMRGWSYGPAARLVLGALAGVTPLVRAMDRPAPQEQWLERLVDNLAADRLDRQPLARCVSAAMALLAGRGVCPRAIRAAHVGVLATRFRQAVFRTARACGSGRGL